MLLYIYVYNILLKEMLISSTTHKLGRLDGYLYFMVSTVKTRYRSHCQSMWPFPGLGQCPAIERPGGGAAAAPCRCPSPARVWERSFRSRAPTMWKYQRSLVNDPGAEINRTISIWTYERTSIEFYGYLRTSGEMQMHLALFLAGDCWAFAR